MADAGKLTTATGLSYLVNLVGGVIIARILAPKLYGVWKTIQLTLQYTQFANGGISLGLGKICPPLVSKDRISLYQRVMGTSLGFSLLIPGMGSLALLAFAVHAAPGPGRIGLLALAFLLPLQQLHTHYDLALAFEKRFGVKARALFGYTVVRVGLCIVLAWAMELTGAVAGFIASIILILLYIAPRCRMGLRWSIDPAICRRLFRVSLPILLIVGGELLVGTADKWVVAGLLGSESMGLYQMAVFPLPILMLVPFTLRQVVNIEIFDSYGRTREVQSVKSIYERSVLVVSLVTPVFIGAVYLGMPWLVNWLLPVYRDCIPATKAHALLVFPLLLLNTGYSVFVVAQREREAFAVQAAFAGICSLTSCLAIKVFRIPFMGVLAIHGTGWVLYGVAILYIIQRLLGEHSRDAVRKVFFWFVPLLYLAIELPLLSRLMAGFGFPPNTFLHATLGGLVHLAACLPLAYILEKKTRAVSDGARMVLRRARTTLGIKAG